MDRALALCLVFVLALVLGLVLVLGACSKAENKPANKQGSPASASAKAPPPPPQVQAMPVIQRPATVTGEVVGEIQAFRQVDLRPQVTGTVAQLYFQPGQQVKQGQVLFLIDPRPYQAALAQVAATVADSEAALARARQDVARYEPLLPDNAIPRATYDQAVAQAKSAQAAVDARKAAADKARLDLEYTKVRSPVTGQIGLQKVEIGALATTGQTVLATVSTLDPVLVYFSISEAEYIRFVRTHSTLEEAGKLARSRPIELILPDGSLYPNPGRIDFVERAITAATGTLTVRARFPNPTQLLRPGMNARVRIIYDVIDDALLVPQRAVTELLGKQFVIVVGPGNKTDQRTVELGDRIGGLWIVKSGLKPGEIIVVDGVQKAPPGTVVRPSVISEAQLDTPALPAVPPSPK
jgi:membrane fusion protein (multidrug efflux system)